MVIEIGLGTSGLKMIEAFRDSASGTLWMRSATGRYCPGLLTAETHGKVSSPDDGASFLRAHCLQPLPEHKTCELQKIRD